MVSTVKFSQFSNVNPTLSNFNVGYTSGANFKTSWPITWRTASRPVSPPDGFSGYNLDLQQWEFWDATSDTWKQFLDSASGFNWTTITASSIGAVANNGYVTNSGSQVQVLLPSVCALGDTVAIMGQGSGGWSLVANAGQTIIFGNQTTSTGGSWSAADRHDNITVSCLVADTVWQVRSAVSDGLIIA